MGVDGQQHTYMPRQRHVAGRDQAISLQASLCRSSLGRSLDVRKHAEIRIISSSRTLTGGSTVQGSAYFWLTAGLAVTKRPVIRSHGCLQIRAELSTAYILIASLQSAVSDKTMKLSREHLR